MPTARARRTLAADPAAVWALAGDPHQLPRWWPLTVRVEGVSGRAFTMVQLSKRGREVRADQRVTADDRPRRRAWALEVEGTPFESVFEASETEVALAPAAGGGTEVELALRQRLRGGARLMGPLVRRSSRRQLRAALDGLERALAEG
ncbi:MAG TPA: SRPBCC family protein [Capillimicrobium sp.]|nr:SRPBCC family protein [Capillimicrobium sp.]